MKLHKQFSQLDQNVMILSIKKTGFNSSMSFEKVSGFDFRRETLSGNKNKVYLDM